MLVGADIWSIGGRSGPSDFGDVYRYDAARDAWIPGPSIEPRGTAGAVLYDGAIHVFGGESQARRATAGRRAPSRSAHSSVAARERASYRPQLRARGRVP
ncbi:MAG TPA: hypothetical protein VK939_09140 [Longimicrobiales bacterium]|nr:hypothetical protein [Longimicrobiales bacterium]